MNTKFTLIAAIALIGASLACGMERSATANNPPTLTPDGQASQAATERGGSITGKITISGVTMYRDDGSGQPGDEVTVFRPADRVMHFEATARGLKTGQQVKLVFTAVDTTAGKNIDIAEAETGKVLVADQITGQVSLTEDWPVGSYRMDIYVDGDLVYSWDYRVEE